MAAEQWDALQKTLPDELQTAGWVATVTSQAALNSKHYVFVYTKAADQEQLPCLKGLKRVRRWWDLNGEAAAAAAEEEEQPKKKKQKKKLRPSDVAAAAAAAPHPRRPPRGFVRRRGGGGGGGGGGGAGGAAAAADGHGGGARGAAALSEPELGNKFEAAGYDKLSDLVTLAKTKAGAAATLGDIGIKECARGEARPVAARAARRPRHRRPDGRGSAVILSRPNPLSSSSPPSADRLRVPRLGRPRATAAARAAAAAAAAAAASRGEHIVAAVEDRSEHRVVHPH